MHAVVFGYIDFLVQDPVHFASTHSHQLTPIPESSILGSPTSHRGDMSSKKSSWSKAHIAVDQKSLADCWNPFKMQRRSVACAVDDAVPICPICNTNLWKDDALNNLHIDSCLQRVEKLSSIVKQETTFLDDPMVSSLKFHTVADLPGLIVIPNFITEGEEENIIRFMDSDRLMDWKFSSFNGDCFSKYFGVKTQFGLPNEIRLVRSNEIKNGEHDLPIELAPYVTRLQHFVALHPQHFSNEVREFKPNECNMNSYYAAEGHYLRPHFDDRTLSGPILMNLSLCGAARMTYAKPMNASLSTNAIATGTFTHFVTVPLPRRCLQLVTGTARWAYTHEIRREDVLSPRRMSITWRQSGGKRGIRPTEAKAGNDVSSLLRKHAEQLAGQSQPQLKQENLQVPKVPSTHSPQRSDGAGPPRREVDLIVNEENALAATK